MDKLLANADPNRQLLFDSITGMLLIGGLVAAFFLARYHRRNPPDRRILTAQIAARSWTTPQVGLVLGVFFLLHLLSSVVRPFFYEEQMPVVQLVATLFIYSIVMVIVALVNRRRNTSWGAGYGMGIRHLKRLVLAPAFYLALIPVLMLSAHAYHLVLEHVFGMELELQEAAQIIAQERSWLQILYMLAAILAAPLYEEVLFRGMLFPYLAKRAGLAGGTLLVSAFFALLHFHLPSFVPLFLLSTALCLAYWRTGSLWVNIGIHAIFNAVSILALNIVG